MLIRRFINEKRGMLIVTLLIILLIMIYMAPNVFITVYSGHNGVLFRRFLQGTVMDRTFGEGLHIIFPWDRMYIYDLRIQEVKKRVHVLSSNGLIIDVDVSTRYHVHQPRTPILHVRVGQDYLDKVIKPAIVSAVRKVIGAYRPDELYSGEMRQLMQDEMLVELIEETGRIPIIYNALVIENIRLPDVIEAAIEQKLRQEQLYLEYEFRLQRAAAEAQRKEIEAVGIKTYQDIIADHLPADLLTWLGIKATLELASSPNAKIVIVGGGKDGLPIILNTGDGPTTAAPQSQLSDSDPERFGEGFMMNASQHEHGLTPSVSDDLLKLPKSDKPSKDEHLEP